jgi:hypothetical protein
MKNKLSAHDRGRILDAYALYSSGLSAKETGMRVATLLRLGVEHGLMKGGYRRPRAIESLTARQVRMEMRDSRSMTECARRLHVDPRTLKKRFGHVIDAVIRERGARLG